MSATSPGEAARALVLLSLAAGTRDNVTAVVCDVGADAPASVSDRAVFCGAAAARFCEDLDTA